MFTKLRFQTAG